MTIGKVNILSIFKIIGAWVMGQNLNKAGVVGTLAVVAAGTFLGGCQTVKSAIPARDRFLTQPVVSETKDKNGNIFVEIRNADGAFLIDTDKTAYVIEKVDGVTKFGKGRVNSNANVLAAVDATKDRTFGESVPQFTIRDYVPIDASEFNTFVNAKAAAADFTTLAGVFRAPVDSVIGSLSLGSDGQPMKVSVQKLPVLVPLSNQQNITVFINFTQALQKQAEPAKKIEQAEQDDKQNSNKVSFVLPNGQAAITLALQTCVRGARA